MSRIIVLGGGVVGLAVAIMASRRGHDVTVFERDADPLPHSPQTAWLDWRRRGVAQLRQGHYLHSAARQILEAEMPDVKEALLRAGCVAFDPMGLMPPSITDRTPQDGDDRFVTVTGRRVAIEYAFAESASKVASIERGIHIVGLIAESSRSAGVPHVTGVRATDGREVEADLVIDVMGRRSPVPRWLQDIGARKPIEEAKEYGFVYYTRFFKGADKGLPQFRAGLQTHFHSFSLLTLPGDSSTWSVTVVGSSIDPALKGLREPALWNSVVQACPSHAHWLDAEPISGVHVMAGVADRNRRYLVEGVPVATGIVSVGDACICTNPIGGRGITMGLMHAAGTVEM